MWSFGRQRPGASQVLPCAAALAAFFATLLLASAAAFWLGAQPAAEALLRSLIAPSAAHPAPISAEEEPGESIDGEPINGKSSEGESIGGGATRGTDAAAASAFGSDSFLLEENASVPQILEFDLIKTYPHDRRAFTQACSCKQWVVGCKAVVSISAVHAIPVISGLLYMDHEASGGRGSGEGVFYESTGEYGRHHPVFRSFLHPIPSCLGPPCPCPLLSPFPGVPVPLLPLPLSSFPMHPPFSSRVQSTVREVDVASGEVLNSVPQSADVFGEGLALRGDRLYQLAWRVRSGLVYDRETLRPQGEIKGGKGKGDGWCYGYGEQFLDLCHMYDRSSRSLISPGIPALLLTPLLPGSFQHGMADGWGLAVLNGSVMVGTDGSSTLFHLDSSSFKDESSFEAPQRLDEASFEAPQNLHGWGLAVLNESVMVGTDGSSTLFHLDSSSFKAVARVTVKDGKRSIPNLNELEVVRGLVWANVWLSNCLAAIHPDTGKVLAWLDLSSLQ
ncbi:unnamed protein product [Closterium sp. NIES-65]|nr:unnamed protein product [Closterium sp. NIES-65]